MLLLSIVAGFLLNVCVAQHFLDPPQLFLSVCYNDTRYTLDRRLPPFSLDNLLAIIEKIENHPSINDKKATTIATILLKKFRVDGIKSERLAYGETAPVYNLNFAENKRGHVILKIVSSFDYMYRSVDFLTNDEKCALHWMLSHSINDTRMHEEDDLNWRPITPSPYSRKRRQTAQIHTRSEFSSFPRENGVVYTPTGEAIAIGSVLAGIALMRDTSKIRFNDIDNNIDSKTEVKDEAISRLDAATYAINLALDAQKLSAGPRGIWNDSICPTEYTLNEPATSVPDALLFGSFDGYFIGKTVGTIYGEQIMLSQILRMYYSEGFKGNREVRACNRIKQLKAAFDDPTQNEHIINEVSKAIVIAGYTFGGSIKYLTPAKELARKLFDNIRKNYTDNNFNFPSQQQCEILAPNSEPKVYALVDLFVIIESTFFQSQTRYEEMSMFITNVANHLDISKNTSHIGLYIENKNLFHSFMPMNATLSVAEWKCEVQKFDRTKLYAQGHADQTVETIRLLKEMLIERKTHDRNREIAGRPGEVVLFLRSGSLHNSEAVTWEMELFRKDHPEIKVIAAARSRNDVEPLIGKDNFEDFLQFFSGSVSQMRSVADKFYKDHLRRVGATIYFPYCERDLKYFYEVHGYLPPFSRQFHIMPSSMFNLSKELKIDVRAQGVALQACLSREADLFKASNRLSGGAQCMDITSTSGGSNALFFGDPCNSFEAGRCPPIYIQIKRKEPAESGDCYSPRAGENLCRTYDDVRYLIRVEDGRCGGCIAEITLSLFILCVTSLLL